MNAPRPKLIYALDQSTLADARAALSIVADEIGMVKIGLELFVKEGPAAVSLGREFGLPVFLDLKLHDIPETVARAVRSAGTLGARMLTVHAGGGRAMLERAREEANATGAGEKMDVVAVTVLTSLADSDLDAQSIHGGTAAHAERLARVAWDAGVRMFVCSPHEVRALRESLGKDAAFVTPGVRPKGSEAADQKRVATAEDAVKNGADWIVVGRPIRDAKDPRGAARAIADEMKRARDEMPMKAEEKR